MDRILLTICGAMLVILAFAGTGHSQSVDPEPKPETTDAATESVTESDSSNTTVKIHSTTKCDDRGDSPECRTNAPKSTTSASTFANATQGDDSATTTSSSQTDTPDNDTATTAGPLTSNVTEAITGGPTDGTNETTLSGTTEVVQTGNVTDYLVVTTTQSGANTTEIETETVASENVTGNATSAPGVVPQTEVVNITEAMNETFTTAPEVNATLTQADDSTTVTEKPTELTDPCLRYEMGYGTHYAVKQPAGSVDCFGSFNFTTESWYRFYVNTNENAEIPLDTINQGYCGVKLPFRVRLGENDTLPAENQTQAAQLCTLMTEGATDTCTQRKNIEIRNCMNQFYLYQFSDPLQTPLVCKEDGGAGICLKKKDEDIDPEYIFGEEAPTTTELPPLETTEKPKEYILPSIDPSNMTEEMENGTITIEYTCDEECLKDTDNITAYWAVHKDEKFRTWLAEIITSATCGAPQKAPPADLVETTAAAEIQTTAAEIQTTTTTVKERPPTWFTTGKIVATAGDTTTTTTTTTTPAPVEPKDQFEKVTVEYDPNDGVLQATVARPEGPKVPDSNTDNDGDIGPGAKRRRRKDAQDCEPYTMDDVYYVYDTPVVSYEVIQVSFVVIKGGISSPRRSRRAAEASGKVLSQDDLFDFIENADKKKQEEDVGLKYEKHYKGRPVTPEKSTDAPLVGPTDPQKSMWETHMGLFIAIIILIILCLIVVIIGILCIKCKGKKSTPEKTPLRSEEGMSPTVIENPISDEEIVKGEAPMTEAYNPAYTPNGSGHHLTKGDEDNGWIVPMDELTYAERERPEVDNTRL